MTKIRVLRILEYVYDDVETMAEDMERWSMQSQPGWLGGRVRMRSATVSLDALLEEATPSPASVETVWFRCPDHPSNRVAMATSTGATAAASPCVRWTDPDEAYPEGHFCGRTMEPFIPTEGEYTG